MDKAVCVYIFLFLPTCPRGFRDKTINLQRQANTHINIYTPTHTRPYTH